MNDEHQARRALVKRLRETADYLTRFRSFNSTIGEWMIDLRQAANEIEDLAEELQRHKGDQMAMARTIQVEVNSTQAAKALRIFATMFRDMAGAIGSASNALLSLAAEEALKDDDGPE